MIAVFLSSSVIIDQYITPSVFLFIPLVISGSPCQELFEHLNTFNVLNLYGIVPCSLPLCILKSKDDKRNKWKNIRQAVADARIQDFTELYSFLYEKVDDYGGTNTSNIILILSESQHKDALVVDKEITFMSCIIQIVGII